MMSELPKPSRSTSNLPAAYGAFEEREPVSSPTLTVLAGFAVLLLFFGGVFAWVMFVPLSATVNAPGEVVFQGKRQAVQHLEGGIIQKILVKNGDSVVVGQPLIELESAQVQPLVKMFEEQSMAELAQTARLEAESGGLDGIAFPSALASRTSDPAVGKLMSAETNLFRARKEAFEHQLELVRLQMSQVKESIVGSQERHAAKKKEIASIEEQLAANESLHKEGYVPRTVVLDLQRVLAERIGEREAIAASIAADQQRIQEYEQRMRSLKADRVQGAINELKQSGLRRIDLQERVRPVRDTLERQIIRSPVAGKVVGIRVSTIGGVIMPRDTLMEIAPTGDELMVEARLRVEDISEVKVGQSTEVTISGLNRRNAPPLKAKVTYISDDRIMPVGQPGALPYYAAYIEFDREFLKEHADLQLMPGMNANAAIGVKPHTTFDYIIVPIRDKLNKVIYAK